MHDWSTWDFTCTATVWDLAAPEHPVPEHPDPAGVGGRPQPRRRPALRRELRPALEVYDVATGALLRSIALTPDLAAGNYRR